MAAEPLVALFQSVVHHPAALAVVTAGQPDLEIDVEKDDHPSLTDRLEPLDFPDVDDLPAVGAEEEARVETLVE